MTAGQIFVLATLLSTAMGQLATEGQVDTRELDELSTILQNLRGAETVEGLQARVERKAELREAQKKIFQDAAGKEGYLGTSAKLTKALRQTAAPRGGLTALDMCAKNQACIKALFDRLDTNNDGKINEEEYQSYTVDDGSANPEQQEKRKAASHVLRTLRTADVNGDDVISPQEFEMWREDLDLVDDAKLTYETFDTDQDGEVSKREFARALLKIVDDKQKHSSEGTAKQVAMNLLDGAETLVDIAKAHANLEQSFKSATDDAFKARLQEVDQIELEGAVDRLRQANEKVLKINKDAEKVPRFHVTVEGKKYLLEGNSKAFYRNMGKLADEGFDRKQILKAMVAGGGHTTAAKQLLCLADESGLRQCEGIKAAQKEQDKEAGSFLEGGKNEDDDEDEDQESFGIELPEPSNELPSVKAKKAKVISDVIDKLTTNERKALLSNQGRKHLRALMPKKADAFSDGLWEKDAFEESTTNSVAKTDKIAAVKALKNVGQAAMQPAVDAAELGLQMVLGPKDEFRQNFPKAVDDIMTLMNKKKGLA
jgi:Ca2+-binding EF-hand superfamily protein